RLVRGGGGPRPVPPVADRVRAQPGGAAGRHRHLAGTAARPADPRARIVADPRRFALHSAGPVRAAAGRPGARPSAVLAAAVVAPGVGGAAPARVSLTAPNRLRGRKGVLDRLRDLRRAGVRQPAGICHAALSAAAPVATRFRARRAPLARPVAPDAGGRAV